MTELEGRVALVTGAAQGLGLAIATAFVAAGATVVLADVAGDAVRRAAEELAGPQAGEANSTVLDVTDPAAVTEAVGAVHAEHGRLDILVNNAGVLRDARIDAMTDEQWDTVLNVSLRGAFNATRAAFPLMKAAGFGRILSMSSMCWRGTYGQANYATAKAGIVGLMRTVALEGAAHGITANAIAPGTIETPMLQSLTGKQRDRLAASVPVGRVGRPEEIARAALFLCAPEAGYLTGVVLDVDGGASISASLR